MPEVFDRAYVGNAWSSLKMTKNLMGKLLLLFLLQFIPILGQVVLLAYALRWAREAAWGMRTPLPDHMFGSDDPQYWQRGFKAFGAVILYGLIIAAIEFTVQFALSFLLVAAIESPLFLIIYGVAQLVLGIPVLLLMMLFPICLIRMAIYDRFSCAFQLGVAWRMLFHRFGGYLKLILFNIFISFLLFLTFLIPVILLILAVVLSAFSLAVAVGYEVNYATISFSLSTLAFLPVMMFIELLSTMIYLLIARALGHWVATFNVPAWGDPSAFLPFQRQKCAGADAALFNQVVAVPQSPVPQHRSHPVMIWVVMFILSLFMSIGCVGLTYTSLSAEATVRIQTQLDEFDNPSEVLTFVFGSLPQHSPLGTWQLEDGQYIEFEADRDFKDYFSSRGAEDASTYMKGTYTPLLADSSALVIDGLEGTYDRERLRQMLASDDTCVWDLFIHIDDCYEHGVSNEAYKDSNTTIIMVITYDEAVCIWPNTNHACMAVRDRGAELDIF